MSHPINRRHMLRAGGSLVALPFLPSLGFRRFARAAEPAAAKRLVFLGFGWGVTNESWRPARRR